MSSYFAPGKLILLGEHGVVYGHPALAAAISRGVRAYVTPGATTQLEVPEGLTPVQAAALERAFATAAKLTKHPKLTVSLHSDLPVSMGLGSSGALAVAIARALGAKDVDRVALAMEKEFHGTPSGVDHTTSARGTMVLFQKGKARVVKARRPVKVLVALVGERASTKSTVGALRERQARWPQRYARVFGEIGRLVKEGVGAVQKGDLDSLGDLMNLNQGMLAALGLSSDRLDAMARRLRAHGALGAKLTGAGGDGGAVIGLFPEPEPVVKMLTGAGIVCFASQLAGPVAL